MTVARLKACFDESGDSFGGHYYSMAGLIGTLRQWRSFYPRWRKALLEKPSIAYFKMSEAARGGRKQEKWKPGQFDGWTRHDINKKVERLTDVVRKSGMAFMAIVIPMRSFRYEIRLLSGDKDYEDPYITCFFQSLRVVAGFMENLESPQAKPMLVYDTMQKRSILRVCRDLFEDIRSAEPDDAMFYPVGKWMPSDYSYADDKKQELGLQAADLIAWHARTLPYESEFKRHRRRAFAGQLNGLPWVSGSHGLNQRAMRDWRWALQSYIKKKAAERLEEKERRRLSAPR
jgi:hypothetical protein